MMAGLKTLRDIRSASDERTNPELSKDELFNRYKKKAASQEIPTRRSPFKFLDSYDESDSDIFFGRDAEIEEIQRLYHGPGHVLIYGESGSGKSSLVQCGLRAKIPEDSYSRAGLNGVAGTFPDARSRSNGWSRSITS